MSDPDERPLRPRERHEIARWLRRAADYLTLPDKGDRLEDLSPLSALARRDAESTTPDGYRTATGRVGSGGGGHSDPTQSDGLARAHGSGRPDPVRAHHRHANAAIRRAFRAALDAMRSYHYALALPDVDERAGIGYCLRCARWVIGSADDRLRSGLCPRHYQQWRRARFPERHLTPSGLITWDGAPALEGEADG